MSRDDKLSVTRIIVFAILLIGVLIPNPLGGIIAIYAAGIIGGLIISDCIK